MLAFHRLASLEHDVTFGEEPQHLLSRLLKDRGSTQPAEDAVKLLRHYGSVPNVLDASWFGLWSLVGFRLAGAIRSIDRGTRNQVQRAIAVRPLLKDRSTVRDFLEDHDTLLTEQTPLVIYVDSQLRVIRTEIAQRHADTQGAVDASSPALRGMAIGAAAYFLVLMGAGKRGLVPNAEAGLTLREFSNDCGVPLIAQVLVREGEILFVPTISKRLAELAGF